WPPTAGQTRGRKVPCPCPCPCPCPLNGGQGQGQGQGQGRTPSERLQLDVEPLQLGVEGRAADPEDLRRFLLVAVRRLDGALDDRALRLLERRPDRDRDRFEGGRGAPHRLGEVLRLDDARVARGLSGAADRVPQLADVARPAVALEDLERGRRERPAIVVLALLIGELGQEAPREPRDVLLALAEGRHR